MMRIRPSILRLVVVRGDALAPATWRDGAASPAYDLIFMDPPYALLEAPGTRRTTLAALASLTHAFLSNDGYLVLHAPRRRLAPGDFGDGVTAAERVYGTNSLWFVRRA